MKIIFMTTTRYHGLTLKEYIFMSSEVRYSSRHHVRPSYFHVQTYFHPQLTQFCPFKLRITLPQKAHIDAEFVKELGQCVWKGVHYARPAKYPLVYAEKVVSNGIAIATKTGMLRVDFPSKADQ